VGGIGATVSAVGVRGGAPDSPSENARAVCDHATARIHQLRWMPTGLLQESAPPDSTGSDRIALVRKQKKKNIKDRRGRAAAAVAAIGVCAFRTAVPSRSRRVAWQENRCRNLRDKCRAGAIADYSDRGHQFGAVCLLCCAGVGIRLRQPCRLARFEAPARRLRSGPSLSPAVRGECSRGDADGLAMCTRWRMLLAP